jgi:transcriptional regulator with XRE-family HTH domain
MNKEEIKKRREDLGMKQTDLAEELGLTSVSVSRWETGTVDIPKWLGLVFEALEARQIKKLQKRLDD